MLLSRQVNIVWSHAVSRYSPGRKLGLFAIDISVLIVLSSTKTLILKVAIVVSAQLALITLCIPESPR